jgi:hypothetical protein
MIQKREYIGLLPFIQTKHTPQSTQASNIDENMERLLLFIWIPLPLWLTKAYTCYTLREERLRERKK